MIFTRFSWKLQTTLKDAARRTVAPRGAAPAAEPHLALDAVSGHTCRTQPRRRRAQDAVLAVLVQARRAHGVDAVVLARHELLPRGTDAAHEPERSTVLAGPVR